MAYRFQFRGDKEANWKGVILADREIGLLISDDGKNTNLYKIGDGKTVWENLSYFGFDGTISSSLLDVDGENTDKSVLSKKAVIDKFDAIGIVTDELDERLSSAKNDITDINAELIDINTELTTIKDNIKDNIGDKPEGYENIYTELTTIKNNIGDKPEGYKNIYTELTDIKSNKYNTTVLSEQNYKEMVSDGGSGLQNNTLYFVYDE